MQLQMPYKVLAIALFIISCQAESDRLPILGEKIIKGSDTIFHTIQPFTYYNQDSLLVNKATFEDKIYVADLFFTSCPTICPRVMGQMLRLQDAFEDEDRLNFLSMSMDYRKDSIPVLKRYADKVGINGERWHLVQLQKNEIEKVANEYFSVAYEDESVAGGFDHSGNLMLVDEQGRIRAYCNGQDEVSVDEFIPKIRQLLDEK